MARDSRRRCAARTFLLETKALPHFVPNAGVRLSCPDFTVAYTGDTGPDPALAELGRNADLYIVEATSRGQQSRGQQSPGERSGDPPAPIEERMLMTARDAGAAAESAGASRLMLTHFWPANDREQSRTEAAEEFRGEILLADEGLVVPLGR